MTSVPLTSLLKETLKLHRMALPESIELVSRLDHMGLVVRGDISMLQQMVLNLLSNARDALERVKVPVIELSLEPVEIGDRCYERHPELAGKRLVCLGVEDNGCGIPEDKLSSVFDPFFTTKEVGKGTGLGLAMIYGAMQTHGGVVEVSHREAGGACFRLYFPCLDQPVADVTPRGATMTQGDNRGVLLADDEGALREVLVDVLSSIGYRVFEAVDGHDALKQFRLHQQDIDVAILDVVMPGMGGPEACRELRAIEPSLPVIFHTGYGQGALVDEVMQQPRCKSLTKPVRIEELAATIADLLQRSV